ncbi:substrate-binding periplasmic protein [Megalodesulfovibrio gigas]|uniref:Putative family 3 extracellular solute-binding protein n=1 Tax=Megalodesulfovibrio gigas (strain ATCC 19364 / DSM 1382 / NCIMB 9332 / VKM B-1759) TaxID=1121448 RepID=T2GE07_MEGG1|nr:transporter substrate-binding domain-containing protein [Megalodesulfovibrio gigas]AGW14414.1 putative family 3 extracellular solute-binding protein [Megalodesulfovibrio gigas DSM 1382 = ATCC 19364]
MNRLLPALLLLAAVLVAPAFWPAGVLAGESLRFACDHMAPFSYEEDGCVVGEAVEAVRQICAQAGCEPLFSMQPWPWVLESMRRGQDDAVFTALRTPEREAYLAYCEEPLGMAQNLLVGCTADAATVSSFAHLQGALVGVIKGYATTATFATSALFARDESPNTMTMLRKCLAGRLDYMVIDRKSIDHLCAIIPEVAMLPRQPYVVNESPYFIAFSKAHGDKAARWLPRIDAAIRELRRQGALPPLP